MKADRDDAPIYLRTSQVRSPWKLALCLGLGSLVFWGAVVLFGKPVVINLDVLRQAITVGDASPPNEPVTTNQSTGSQSDILQPAMRVVEGPAPQAALEWTHPVDRSVSAPTQNVFNDHNYVPKASVNTYASAAVRRATASPANAAEKVRSVKRERAAEWIRSWNGGTRYWAAWEVVGNYIEGSSVCANHKRGSIDYRECRKAAKQHFNEQCRVWRARYDNDGLARSDRMKTRYCSAASGFNPMS